MRLARLARDAALRVPGVIGTDAGPSGVVITEGAQQRLEGVLCVATKDGGYDVTLRLVCGLVPLLALGDAVEPPCGARPIGRPAGRARQRAGRRRR